MSNGNYSIGGQVGGGFGASMGGGYGAETGGGSMGGGNGGGDGVEANLRIVNGHHASCNSTCT